MTDPSSGEEAAGAPGADSREPLYLSVSAKGRLASCERKFLYHINRERTGVDDKGYGASLGTLLHHLIREAMFKRDWRPKWEELLTQEPGWDPEWEEPEHFLHAQWLMGRWDEVHGDDDLMAITAELYFDLPLPDFEPEVRIIGYIDGLDKAPDRDPDLGRPHGLILDEIKSMGRWGKATRAAWEPQLPTYLWAARELGLPVTGALFRAIGTAHKRDAKKPAPARDSFRDIWVPYDQVQVDKVLDDYRRSAARALELIEHPDRAIRNPGESCTWCPFKKDCLW
jgi:hypothetical protein